MDSIRINKLSVKMIRIYSLKERGFSRMEENSYADDYGINVVFNESGDMVIATANGDIVRISNTLVETNGVISDIRRKIINP